MKDIEKLQRRSIDDIPTIIADEKLRVVSGYALKFNTLSCDLGGYIETIDPSALDETIIKQSDIFAVINHSYDCGGVLARSRFGKGKLLITVDNIGLRYEFKLSDSPVHNQLRQYLDDEIITKSSFSFTISDYQWVNNSDGSEYVDENGLQRLIIKRFDKIFDVSPVFEPAYQDTECKIRTSNAIDTDILNELSNRQSNMFQKRQQKLDQYFTQIRKKYGIR